MASVSDLNIRLGLITRLFDQNLAKVERDLRNSGRRLSSLGSELTFAISAPLGAFGVASIKAAGDTEALTLALEAQVGSAEAARTEYELLRKAALKPGLALEQALRGSVALQAVGFNAEFARKTLANFGNALALAGKGKAELDGVVLALTQISAKGKVSAEEINQIAERLPQIRTLMKQAFGTADTEALQKLGITSEQFIAAINRELEKLPQATGGINNSIENVGDAINQFLAGIGQEINKAFDLKQVGEDIQRSLGGALEWFQRLDDGTKRTIVQFGLLAVALGPAIKLYGVFKTTLAEGVGIYGDIRKGLQNVALGATQAATAFRSLNLATQAFVLVGIAVAIYSALDAMGAFNRELSAAEKAQMSVAAITRQATEDVSRERVQVNELSRVLKDNNATRSEQEKALKALQSIAPEHFKNLTVETAKTGQLDQAVNAYIDSLLRAAKAKRAFARLEEIDKLRENLVEAADPSIWQELGNAVLSAGNGLTQVGLNASTQAKNFAKLRNELNQEEEALRDVIRENGDFVSTIRSAGEETKNFGNSVGAAGDGLSKKMSSALTAVNANLSAFEEKLKLYGPTAESAEKKNILLASSIDKLLKAGFSATSEQVRKLKDELSASIPVSDEARRAAAELRGEFFQIGFTLSETAGSARQFNAATGQEMRSALEDVNANLAAFDANLKQYGPTAESAAQKNALLAGSIDALQKAGFSETSAQVQLLRDKLSSAAVSTDAARLSASELRTEYFEIGLTLDATTIQAGAFAGAIAAGSEGLSKQMRAALEAINANLAAFDANLKQYGPTAESAAQKNALLAGSIDALQKAGFSETSAQVQLLRDKLSSAAVSTDAARLAASELRAEYFEIGLTLDATTIQAGAFAGAIAAGSEGLSKQMRAALEAVNANLTAFDASLKQHGPTADIAVQKNLLLAGSIDALQKAGFSETSDQVQQLRDELSKTTGITDEARTAYERLREEWSKPVSIEAKPAIPTLPQANPLDVGGPAATPEQLASPTAGISIGALNEGLQAINALTLGLQNLVATGLTPAQAIMQGLQNDTLTFSEAFNAMVDDVNANGTVMQQIALGLGQSFQDAANSGANSFSDFAREFIKSAAKIIRTQIQIAVTNAALSALQSTPYPYNLILAGIAGAAAGSLFQALVNKIAAPKLAGGGVIDKPTFALLGEYPGAGTNPEIAAPESKLRQIFRSEQGGGGAVEVFGTIRGGDIFISNQKASRDRGRIR